ncbi:hypothetical protein Cgig2_001668 [Carnegiea gigantea]|uniref:Uncharacterized protein n=1 Tax=Carnegiea gigantea TaxID=171969 RepID=A0A9Q1JYN4_9CARY|nr:hypothetical protein Cgig2_001668 [Carnegiea gigantea]
MATTAADTMPVSTDQSRPVSPDSPVADSFSLPPDFLFPPPPTPPLPLSSAALSPPLQPAPYSFALPQPTVPTPMQSLLPSHGFSSASVGSLGFYSSPPIGSTSLHSAPFLAAPNDTCDPSWIFSLTSMAALPPLVLLSAPTPTPIPKAILSSCVSSSSSPNSPVSLLAVSSPSPHVSPPVVSPPASSECSPASQFQSDLVSSSVEIKMEGCKVQTRCKHPPPWELARFFLSLFVLSPTLLFFVPGGAGEGLQSIPWVRIEHFRCSKIGMLIGFLLCLELSHFNDIATVGKRGKNRDYNIRYLLSSAFFHSLGANCNT